MVKDWTTVEEAKADGVVFGIVRTPRTKERLVTAHRDAPRAAVASPEVHQLGLWATCNLRDGDVAGALDMLARAAGRLRMEDWFRGFDLRGVDEQGHLLAAGGFDTRMTAARGDAPAPPAAGDVIEWKAGEHLDDVLARGAAAVERRARESLCRPLPASVVAGVSVLKEGELLVIEVPENARHVEDLARSCEALCRTTAHRVLLIDRPATRMDIAGVRRALHEIGYDVVPVLQSRPTVTGMGLSAATVRQLRSRLNERRGGNYHSILVLEPADTNARGERCPYCLEPPGALGCSSCSVPGVDPAAVRTKDGTVVNLRDPANLRPGMVFWSKTYHQAEHRRFTCGALEEDDESGEVWCDAARPTVQTSVGYSAQRFLGMDPGVPGVDPADVERFGVAAHLSVAPSGDVYDLDEVKEAANAYLASAEDRL